MTCRRWLVSCWLVAWLASACQLPPTGATPSATAEATFTASGSPAVIARPRLPLGFPLVPFALPAELPASDPELAAAWTVPMPPTATYDFYVEALPAAGFELAGLFTGGGGAVIRFVTGDGGRWQVVIGGSVPTRVEVRLDRP